jgi:hypothetical protein
MLIQDGDMLFLVQDRLRVYALIRLVRVPTHMIEEMTHLPQVSELPSKYYVL